MGHFATGVAIVTGMASAEPVGMTVQSLVSVSLEPPLVLFCPGKSSTSWPRIADTGGFAVSVLGQEQRKLCSVFGRQGADKFAEIDWKPGLHGCPLLEGALVHIECETYATHDAGDHHVVLGRVLRVGHRPTEEIPPGPLLFYRGAYAALAPS